jgi:DNA polymerase lambda
MAQRVCPQVLFVTDMQIDEFLTGAKGRAYYENTEQARTIATFKDIYGVGKSFANTLYQRGARTIEDLRTGEYGLTSGQKVGRLFLTPLTSRLVSTSTRTCVRAFRATNAARSLKISKQLP